MSTMISSIALVKETLSTQEAISGILGSISLASWLFLLLPQLLENYRNSSAEAVSLTFIFLWFIGDVASLAGALWAGLVPMVIVLGTYFCILDGILIGQCLYYGIRNRRREGKNILQGATETTRHGSDAGLTSTTTTARPTGAQATSVGEDEPLLASQRTNSFTVTIPGSQERRRRSSASSGGGGRRRTDSAAQAGRNEQLAKILEEVDENGTRLWVKNFLSIFAVIAVGAIGWGIAYGTGAWKPTPPPEKLPQEDEDVIPGAQILGYASAILYLGARIPQIIKNARERSCEGLSLLFFMLSLLGNLSYGAGILAHSVERQYFIKNIPWLIGSLGTMVEDVIIFVQFHLYRNNKDEIAVA